MHPFGQMFMVLRCICLVYGVLLFVKFGVHILRLLARETW